MESFRTIVTPHPSQNKITFKQPILTLGSCFSDAIGLKFQQYKFNALANPFGAIYNPVSLHKVLRYATLNEQAPLHTYHENNNIHFNYDFHSQLSALNGDSLRSNVNAHIEQTHRFLKHTQWLILTYGTAWVYERKDTCEIVSNCHKMNADLFSKWLLTQKKIIDSFSDIYVLLKQFNPSIRIVLTVSPVRHTKETLALNSVSKSLLRVACHTLTETFPDVEYFPSYEIMMDDLRDYRFYKEDMLHPTEQAEDYIWKKFLHSYIDEPTKNLIAVWGKLRPALYHKPFHPSSAGHQIFIQQTIQKLEELKHVMNVDEEIKHLTSQLLKY